MNKFLSVIGLALIVGCGPQKKEVSNVRTFEVKRAGIERQLHFSGVIQPLHENSISSPMEAVVETMNFHYGQLVKKNDIIITLNSSELQKQFNDTLTEYLKAKDSYSIAKAKFAGTQDLWDSGLISKNNWLSEKSNLNNVRVSLMQAGRKLSEMLEKVDEHNTKNMANLSLADFEKIKNVLATEHNLIRIKAPSDGVLLYPPKADQDKSARISVGASIKSGQVIALIGDLTGISVEIEIPEIDISQVHTGMNASISGIAFGKHPLQGKLVAINAQATATSNGLPFFTAVVEVKSLTPEQQRWIKVGMSASIALDISEKQQISIPIAAIFREKGQNKVRVKKAGNQESEVVTVTTGSAEASTVVITNGLVEGDVVLYE